MELQVFRNAEFGSVRTTVIDGEPYIVGKDVAEILGYTNPQKALRDHVDDEDKTLNETFTVNEADTVGRHSGFVLLSVARHRFRYNSGAVYDDFGSFIIKNIALRLGFVINVVVAVNP